MPRSRIPRFTTRIDELCDQAGLPRHDDTHYDVLQDLLLVRWTEPGFCIGIPLATASINGLTADELRAQWERKFGPWPAAA